MRRYSWYTATNMNTAAIQTKPGSNPVSPRCQNSSRLMKASWSLVCRLLKNSRPQKLFSTFIATRNRFSPTSPASISSARPRSSLFQNGAARAQASRSEPSTRRIRRILGSGLQRGI